ncbi:MAG: DUF1501 domain-containing protein [Planctomycetota bacterium]|nr:DUF1501 domain-containing protein [Planctomycetota bacterium]
MLTILGKPNHNSAFCDGLSRRGFLKIGSLAMGGMSLPGILRAEQAIGKKSQKSVIMIYLPGGPPHQDMVDMKPNAPSEIRGEFKPISTNVSGIQICELMPRIAGMMDKFSIVRSIVGADTGHDAMQCQTGRSSKRQPAGGWPSFGSSLSKLMGPVDPSVPGFVGLAPKMRHVEWADPGQPGYLGIAHAPFRPEGEGRADMVLKGISLDRLRDRKALLTSFDQFRRDADSSGMMAGMDKFNQQALGVLSSSQLAQALDISNEDPRVIERYGKGDPNNQDDGGPLMMEHMLVARRLIESGVRCVTLAFGRWDWHHNTFPVARKDIPMLDQGVSALVEDLHNRGLDKDVSVIVWGEFGRTPYVNDTAGRDHWPAVNCALLAGGGMRTGQVIGSTDRQAATVQDRPVTFGDMHATLYQRMGIDTSAVTLNDLSGRPQFLVEDGSRPLPELI